MAAIHRISSRIFWSPRSCMQASNQEIRWDCSVEQEWIAPLSPCQTSMECRGLLPRCNEYDHVMLRTKLVTERATSKQNHIDECRLLLRYCRPLYCQINKLSCSNKSPFLQSELSSFLFGGCFHFQLVFEPFQSSGKKPLREQRSINLWNCFIRRSSEVSNVRHLPLTRFGSSRCNSIVPVGKNVILFYFQSSNKFYLLGLDRQNKPPNCYSPRWCSNESFYF